MLRSMGSMRRLTWAVAINGIDAMGSTNWGRFDCWDQQGVRAIAISRIDEAAWAVAIDGINKATWAIVINQIDKEIGATVIDGTRQLGPLQ